MIIIILFSLLWGASPAGEPIEQIPGISLRLNKLTMPQAVDLVLKPPLTLVPGTTDVYRKFIPLTVVRADSSDLARQYAEALSIPDIGTIPKAHNGGMVALYKGYKVFLANCAQFISAAADQLIALFTQYVLPGPFPPSSEKTHINPVHEEMEKLMQEEVRKLIFDVSFEGFEAQNLFSLHNGLRLGPPIEIFKQALHPWPPGGGAEVVCVDAQKQLEASLERRKAALEQEGIIRHGNLSFYLDKRIFIEAWTEQSRKTQRERRILLDRIRTSSHQRLTEQDIEFIEQTVVNPHTNLATIYYVAAKLIQDLTSLEGKEFEKDLCQEKIEAKNKMIDLLKSFFGHSIAVQIFETMFGEE